MEHVKVKITLVGNTDIYEPEVIRFGDHCVLGCDCARNMSFMLGYCSEEEAERRKIPIVAEMEQYNDAVQKLWSVPGFKEHFAACHSYVRITDIESLYGAEAAVYARNICGITNCYPDLVIIKDTLQLRETKFEAAFEIDGKTFSFDVKNSYVDAFVENDTICFLEWTDENIDRTYAFIQWLIEDGIISGDFVDYISQESGFLFADGIASSRHTEAMLYSMRLLKSRGYLREFCLEADDFAAIWNYSTRREDNTVLFTTLSPDYKKDTLLRARLRCLWTSLYTFDEENGWQANESLDLSRPFYFLQDENNQMYISENKAQLGGHKKLKIYGRLDCPSAKKYIAKGQYVKHRVFFKDEETAIAAGYHPCGVCMKEAYKKWKESQK